MSFVGCEHQPGVVCYTMSNIATKVAATSLTIWSSRRLQAPLVGALRAARSGAAYRER